MKKLTHKIISLCLIFSVLMLSVSAFSAFAAESQLYVIKDTTGVYTKPALPPVGEKLTDIHKYAIVTVVEVTNGWGKIYIQGTEGYIHLSMTEPYSGDPADASSIASINIESLPYKTVYTDGESFSAEGIAVSANLKSGEKVALKGFDIIVPPMTLTRSDLADKQQTVTVKYGPGTALTAGFLITVKRLPIDSLKVVSRPKLEYKEGERIDLTGLKVMASYTDGSDETDVTNELIEKTTGKSISELQGKILEPGTYNFEYVYKYNDKKITLQIKVNAKKLTGIRVSSMPTYNVYINKNTLDLRGFVLVAVYDNDTSEPIPQGAYTVSHGELKPNQNNPITVSYGGFTEGFTIFLEEKKVTELVVKQPPDRTMFQLGEQLDTTGLVITLKYNDGTQRDITEGFTVIAPDMSLIGKKLVKVQAHGLEVTFQIYITDRLYTKGDVDNNGKINAADARLVLRYYAKLENLGAIQLMAADVDGNGKVNAADARKILRFFAKLEPMD
ncbi:MAG TPA: dockerin type I repeat-containing protein [Clostridiales bacterium]|nr:dockerin type I repeat-containing protein [Clostridiales bacterium]HXK83322.1 dockerin type I repeat-containing protein [Clostridiales bacterium]